jgi:hypothetical protein
VLAGSAQLHRPALDLRYRTGAAFHGHANLLRLRNGYSVRGLRFFCIGANVMTLAGAVALIVSIGWPRTMANLQVPLVTGLLTVETAFSLAKAP